MPCNEFVFQSTFYDATQLIGPEISEPGEV